MIALPPLGMGCAALGNLYRSVDDDVAEATVAAALDGGICFFDVAPHYGFGLAEERLGRALQRHDPQARAIVSTKVGRILEPVDGAARERHGFVDARPFEPRFDYGRDAVRRSLDESLVRLRRDRVDVLLAHDLGEVTHGADAELRYAEFFDGGYPAMRDLRDRGVVAMIGIGVNEIAACERLLDEVELDIILLAGRYTLLEQDAAHPLLDRCAALGVQVVIGGPYNSGVLVEGSAAAAHFNYAPAPRDVIARVAELERACAAHRVPLPAAALRFPRRHPAVASVIPGMVGCEQVAATLAYAATNIPDALWADCRPGVAA